jgi:catechol 2,3-dioxygenase-like lactoylglutathione lyase family enzyme
VWLLALLVALFPVATVQGRALEVRAIVLTVADLDRSVAFYESALGFQKVGERLIEDAETATINGVAGARIRHATLRLGDESIALEQYLASPGVSLPADSRSNDLEFQHFAIVVRDMDMAYARLARIRHQAISRAPQTIPESNVAAAGIRAYKFRDPDGHPLELLYFPPGRGNPKWQQPGTSVFLGIDHSAITIADTERSLRFWRDLVGLTVAGGSVNSGPTQDDLDGTNGAVVRITGLRPDHTRGPGLEFLQYVMPSGGRPAPAGLRPNDIAHVHLVVEVDDIDDAVDRLARSNAHFVSPRPARVIGRSLGVSVMVADPDEHAVLLVQRRPEEDQEQSR